MPNQNENHGRRNQKEQVKTTPTNGREKRKIDVLTHDAKIEFGCHQYGHPVIKHFLSYHLSMPINVQSSIIFMH